MLLSLIALALAAEPAAPPAASHCTEGETAAFQCALGAKQLALCWAGKPRESALYYRCGKPGAVELAYPSEAKGFEEAFTSAHELIPAPPGGNVRPRLEYTTLSFAIEGVGYQVFEDEEDFVRTQGVRVLLADGKKVELKCTEPSKTSLQELSH